jgi:hypothetical protein
LAGVILIGKKLGKRRLFLIIGLVMQALIFGSAHANYAAQPAYARIVELFIPSLLFAFLYMRFGLLTGILLHFSFDAVLMSLPIWIASAPGIWFGRIAFLVLFLLPIIIVIVRRIQKKQWTTIEEKFLNKSWKPPTREAESIEKEQPEIFLKFNRKFMVVFILFAVIGLFIGIFFTDFQNYVVPLKIDKQEAISLAKKELLKQGVELDSEWKILANVQNTDKSDSFIWQVGGKEIYRQFSGKFINPPLWKIRFAKFSGDVALRAEEYNVYIYDNGKVYYVWNKIPEATEGNVLNETQAEAIALSEIQKRYEIEPKFLKKINRRNK